MKEEFDPASARRVSWIVAQALDQLTRATKATPNGRCEVTIVLVGHNGKVTRESRVEPPNLHPPE